MLCLKSITLEGVARYAPTNAVKCESEEQLLFQPWVGMRPKIISHRRIVSTHTKTGHSIEKKFPQPQTHRKIGRRCFQILLSVVGSIIVGELFLCLAQLWVFGICFPFSMVSWVEPHLNILPSRAGVIGSILGIWMGVKAANYFLSWLEGFFGHG